jgi:hypothetical protein
MCLCSFCAKAFWKRSAQTCECLTKAQCTDLWMLADSAMRRLAHVNSTSLLSLTEGWTSIFTISAFREDTFRYNSEFSESDSEWTCQDHSHLIQALSLIEWVGFSSPYPRRTHHFLLLLQKMLVFCSFLKLLYSLDNGTIRGEGWGIWPPRKTLFLDVKIRGKSENKKGLWQHQ